jgi:predicted transcriptional regulator YheO
VIRDLEQLKENIESVANLLESGLFNKEDAITVLRRISAAIEGEESK